MSKKVKWYKALKKPIIVEFREVVGEEERIKTKEGVLISTSEDFIIKGIKGELYPIKKEIFYQTYEVLNDSSIPPTIMTKFPCPKCGKYYEPYMVNSKGIAMMHCPEHGLFETSVSVSKNFRKFCSKIASNNTRGRDYYTSTEKRVYKILLELGYREGFDFIHNCRFKNGKVYYWLDFYFPYKHLGIEVSPKVWHRMWGREESEKRKEKYFKDNNITLIHIEDVLLNNKRILKKALENILKYSGGEVVD